MTGKGWFHIPLIVLVAGALSMMLPSCDTENNLEPVYEDYYIRLFGDEGNQEGVDVVVSEADQTVLLLGTTTVPSGDRRLLLVKADWAGNLIWKKKLGGANDTAKDLEPAADGGYVILAETRDVFAEDPTENVKLIRITAEGEKLDSVVFGTPKLEGVDYGIEKPVSVTAMDDGYIVTGSLEYTTVEADVGLKKVSYLKLKFGLDLAPVPDTHFRYYNSQAEFATGIKTIRTGENRIYTLGSDNKDENGRGANYNFWYFGFDYTGGESSGSGDNWMGEDKAGYDEILGAVCPAFGEGVFMVGTHIDPSGRADIYTAQAAVDNGELVRRDSVGNIIVIPGDQNRLITPVSVCRATQGQPGYLILGTEGTEGAHNIWLCKVNVTGETVYWSSAFGATDRNDDRAGAVAELPDGHILVVGTVNAGVDNLKMGFFKLNAAGRFASQ